MALLDFYGETPAYLGGLLGEDDLKRLQGQAQSQSNLGMAAALLQAGAPSRTPGGTGLAIAQGLMAGQQLYKQALNQGLQEKMAGMQLGELMRKQQEAEAVRKFLPNIMQTTSTPEQLTMYGQPTQGVIRDDEGNLMPGGGVIPAQQSTTINRDALQRLALAAPEQFAKYSAGLKALQPEYKEVNGQLYEISPYGGKPTLVAGQGKLTYQDLGNVVVALDASGKEVGRMAKGAAPSGPVSMQAVETEKGLMQFNPRTGGMSPVMIDGKPVMGKEAGKLNESQGNATAFGMRMQASNKIIDDLSADKTFRGALVEKVPFVGQTAGRVLPSALGGTSDAQQRFNQAKSNFITAVLRKESGAVIGEDEFAREDAKYFPQVGDSEATIKQKADARKLAIDAMRIQAGPGAKYIPKASEWEVVR